MEKGTEFNVSVWFIYTTQAHIFITHMKQITAKTQKKNDKGHIFLRVSFALYELNIYKPACGVLFTPKIS